MSNGKLPAKQTEDLADQLKQSLARRRPTAWKLVLGTLAICVVLLLLLAWWMYPRRPLTPLQILALDAVVPAEGALKIHTQLLMPGDEPARSLEGHTIVFMGPKALGKAEPAREVTTKSDARGHASSEWTLPDAPLGEFLVKCIDDSEKPGAPDTGRIFVWPNNAPILLVDVDETLNVAEPDEKAIATLKKAESASWRIVYLSLRGAEPREFRTAHLALQKPSKLPRGPILGRLHTASPESDTAARHELIEFFRARFKGPIQAVVKDASSASVSEKAGATPIVIGPEAPANVQRVASWAEVPLGLKND